MSNQFLDRPRRIWPFLVFGSIALLAIIAVGVALESAASPHKPESYAPPAADPLTTQTGGPATNTASPVASVSSEPLTIVQGNQLIDGLHVGYPHSGTGAVSAAVEYWTQLGSTLDPDRAATIARLAADPAWADGPEQLAKGPVATRQTLGLPTTGPVPTGASVQLEPVEYQVRNGSASTTTVLLLADYTTTTPAEGTSTHIGVFPLQMIWTASDWKIADPTDNNTYSNLAAVPGSAQASSDGWAELSQ
jgi:hypothetical protein